MVHGPIAPQRSRPIPTLCRLPTCFLAFLDFGWPSLPICWPGSFVLSTRGGGSPWGVLVSICERQKPLPFSITAGPVLNGPTGAVWGPTDIHGPQIRRAVHRYKMKKWVLACLGSHLLSTTRHVECSCHDLFQVENIQNVQMVPRKHLREYIFMTVVQGLYVLSTSRRVYASMGKGSSPQPHLNTHKRCAAACSAWRIGAPMPAALLVQVFQIFISLCVWLVWSTSSLSQQYRCGPCAEPTVSCIMDSGPKDVGVHGQTPSWVLCGPISHNKISLHNQGW